MIEFTIHPAVNYAVITVSGKNSLADFEHATSKFSAHTDFNRGLHRVCDFTTSDLSGLKTLDFLRYVMVLRKLPIAPNTKVALVSKFSKSLLLMFVNKMTSIDIEIFEDIDAGIHWVTTEQQKANSG